MTPDRARLLVLEQRLFENIPGFEIRYKDQSRWQKFIAVLVWIFNRGYMKDYISTFYPYVYWMTEEDYTSRPWGSFKTLAHEYVHLMDHKQRPFWFGFSYLLPHLIALLAIVAIVAAFHAVWWLFALSFLVFLAPLPSPWRRNWEMRGYTMSMAINAWKHGNIKPDTTNWIAKQFVGSAYYFMWPFRKSINKRLQAAVTRIHNGDVLLTSPTFKQVKAIVDTSDEVVVEEGRRILHAKQVNGKFRI